MYQLIQLTENNIDQYGIGCVKNKKHIGVAHKKEWLKQMFAKGYESRVLWSEEDNKVIAVIEYGLSSVVPRNIEADNFLVIQCLVILDKNAQGLGLGTGLIQQAVARAKELELDGVVALVSKDTWLPDKRAFEANEFSIVATKDQFELLCIKFKESSPSPQFIDCSNELIKYRGLHMLYSNQCPFHKKCAVEISEEANRLGIEIAVQEIDDFQDQKRIPTPFGSFALIYNGEILSYHYVSKRRFQNIMRERHII